MYAMTPRWGRSTMMCTAQIVAELGRDYGMGGKASRDKGNRSERELKHLLHGARIRGRVLTARRVPLSGAMSASGYLIKCECGWASRSYPTEREAKNAAEGHESDHGNGKIKWEWIQ